MEYAECVDSLIWRRLVLLVGDDGLQVSPLPALLTPTGVAIGSRRGDTGHLFSLVQHGF